MAGGSCGLRSPLRLLASGFRPSARDRALAPVGLLAALSCALLLASASVSGGLRLSTFLASTAAG
jgi:hypothetical protein